MIQLSLERLKQSLGRFTEKEIVEFLPYLGLDIESHEGETISVEYSPNRPDYSSQAGITRSLKGLFGVETGCPEYNFGESNAIVKVESDEIRSFRPYISAFFAKVLVTDELIKELITMQEDLTNGIGRRRAKVAIGIHNAEVLKPPFRYYATKDSNFSFVPLYGGKPETISTILKETVQGRQYSHILKSGIYPILSDSGGSVLSMPPIINGELTRLKPGIGRLFFDVTSTDERAGDLASSIMAAMLSDIGAKVETVRIESDTSRITPEMSKKKMRFELELVNRILGLNLSLDEAKNALAKSRLTLDSGDAIIPAYRQDIIHPIDLVEEAELGYGVSKLTPQSAETSLSGSIHPETRNVSKIIEVMVGLGLAEIMNLSLESKGDSDLAANQDAILKVEDPKSESYEYLKSELLPSLLRVLGSSTHEEYPQGIFEAGPVFMKSEADTRVREETHLAAAIGDSSANFTAIKSILEGFLKLTSGSKWKVKYSPQASGVFVPGRSALITVEGDNGSREVGMVGEIAPRVLEALGMKVPSAGFEIDLTWLLGR